MNCLEFRRLLLQNPYEDTPEMQAHEAGCEQCANYATEQRMLEGQLIESFQQIRPPAELADNIQLALRLEDGSRSRRRTWFAAAASVLLIVGATFTSLVNERWERGNMALAQSVLNHIDDEAHHLREAGPVAQGRVKFVFARFGADLVGDVGRINFAAECLMRQRNGVHLVLPGEHGPITAFFMPGEYTEDTLSIDSERFQGRIAPTAWGSVAVVGEHGENLQGMAQKLAQAVRWPVGQESVAGTHTRISGALIAQK